MREDLLEAIKDLHTLLVGVRVQIGFLIKIKSIFLLKKKQKLQDEDFLNYVKNKE